MPFGFAATDNPRLRLTLWAAASTVSLTRTLRGPRHPAWSPQLDAILRVLQRGREKAEARGFDDWAASRRDTAGLALDSPLADGLAWSVEHGPWREAQWCHPPQVAGPGTLLLLPGGGYIASSVRAHRDLAARLCVGTGRPVLTLGYRTAPEHPFPAALNDAREALKRCRVHGPVAVVGGSAGGGLALSLGLDPDPPDAIWALSPWADLRLTQPSLTANRDTDWCSLASLAAQARAYLAGQSPLDPHISPALADPQRFPPTLIQVGGAEMLRDDCQHLAAGLNVRVETVAGMPHFWQVFAPFLAESRAALRRGCAWIQARLDPARPPLIAVRVGDTELRGFELGPPEGQPTVLLHGFPDTAWAWLPMARHLASQGRRVLCPFQRGTWPSATPQAVDAYSKARLTADVMGWLAARELHDVDLVGHDWGGIIGWELAHRVPARLRSFTAIAAPHPTVFSRALRDPRQWLRSWYVAFFQLRGIAESCVRYRDFDAAVARLQAERAPRRFTAREVDDRLAAWRHDLSALLGPYRAIVRTSASERGPIDVPTRVIWGADDASLDPAMAAPSAAQGRDGKAHVLSRSGHWPHLDHPERVCALLLESP